MFWYVKQFAESKNTLLVVDARRHIQGVLLSCNSNLLAVRGGSRISPIYLINEHSSSSTEKERQQFCHPLEAQSIQWLVHDGQNAI